MSRSGFALASGGPLAAMGWKETNVNEQVRKDGGPIETKDVRRRRTELFHLSGCRLYRTGHPLAFCLFWLIPYQERTKNSQWPS